MGRTKPIDYSKTIIYKIKCNDELVLDFYVGHTTCFKSRKCMHKQAVETSKLKIYETIRANGHWNNWTMVEIEVYPCKSSTEARIREQYWIDELQAKLNVYKAYRSEEEKKTYHIQYHKDHAEELIATSSQYYQDHIEKYKAYQAQYHKDNAEKLIATSSQYNKEHIEKYKAYQAQYHKDNAEKLKAYQVQYRQKCKEQNKLKSENK